MLAAVALNRFGLGARPGDTVPGDPRLYLLAQFEPYETSPPPIACTPSGSAVAAALVSYLAQRSDLRRSARSTSVMRGAAALSGGNPAADRSAPGVSSSSARQFYIGAVGARANAALTTPAPFVERLVHFWANHFAVSADKLAVASFAGPLEFEAVRPHVLGNFRDMLLAVEHHAAMLLYLDQTRSVGPNSAVAERRRPKAQRRGLNENLAREILELHTLGARAGYEQSDVVEFARALTGWTVSGFTGDTDGGDSGEQPGSFTFSAVSHEPGQRSIMGIAYDQPGEEQAATVLGDLATHPATARHIATKLVRHFVADDPPPSAVARCEQAFLESKGDLPALYRALIDAPEAWSATPAKFKTPWEWLISGLRAMGTEHVEPQQVVGLMEQLGQPIWRPGQPAGWDDAAASWAAPDAVMRRVEAAPHLVTRAEVVTDAREHALALFPDSLSAETRAVLAQSESPAQALALSLVSPEFMRR